MQFSATFLDRFRWVDGHADVLGLFADGTLLAQAAHALAGPFRASRITKVAGIEARGFVLARLSRSTSFVKEWALGEMVTVVRGP